MKAPNSKLQTPEKPQASRSKPNAGGNKWSLRIEVSLKLEAWSLELFP
jgi:hypothetical protein